jgi:hypothetical protein
MFLKFTYLSALKWSKTAVAMVSTKVNIESTPSVISMTKNRKDLKNWKSKMLEMKNFKALKCLRPIP